MSGLAEIQFQMRQALVQGEVEPLASLITGDADGIKRLTVHRRNYETSLTTALVGKFPATCWLVGTAFVAEVARHFVQVQPPRRPCIAEFGEEFPAFLAGSPGADARPGRLLPRPFHREIFFQALGSAARYLKRKPQCGHGYTV
jgi:hypothetical protein